MRMLPISILFALTFWTGTAFCQEEPTSQTAALPSTSSESVTPAADTEATAVSPDPSAATHAHPTTATGDFTQALETFKAADLGESRKQFSELLTQHPNDPTLLYNLGLVEFTDKHPGKALAYWRKALYLQPGFSPALSGIRQVHRVIPNFKSNETSIAQEIYWRVPLWFFFGSTFVFFVFAGALWILHNARGKKGLASSSLGPVLASAFFLIFLSLSLHAYLSYYLPLKGTVLESPAAIRSAPSEDSPSLLEFNEGDEVVILRTQNNWLQVQKSATAAGWIPKEKVLVHSGF
jgi:tetratricopeptide (TPR) repeat protein